MTAVTIWLGYKLHYYYVWQKHAANHLDNIDHNVQEETARLNRRQFGFNNRYVPKLPISKRMEMYQELGGPIFAGRAG